MQGSIKRMVELWKEQLANILKTSIDRASPIAKVSKAFGCSSYGDRWDVDGGDHSFEATTMGKTDKSGLR